MGLAVAGGEVALGHPEGVPGLPLRERTRLTCGTWRWLEGWFQFQPDEGSQILARKAARRCRQTLVTLGRGPEVAELWPRSPWERPS